MVDDPTNPTNVSTDVLDVDSGISPLSDGTVTGDEVTPTLPHFERKRMPIRYLSDIRRERLVRGLSERIDDSRQRLQVATVEIAHSRATLEQDYVADQANMAKRQSLEFDAMMTGWDRAREANYYQADVTTLASVRREVSGLETLKIEHRDGQQREVKRYGEPDKARC